MTLPQDTAIELAKMRALLPPEFTSQTAAGDRLTVTSLTPPEFDWVQDADNELLDGVGDPNTAALNAPTGTLFVDRTDGAPKLWQNQDGGTTWTDLTASGGSGSFPLTYNDGTQTFKIDANVAIDELILEVRLNAGSVLKGQIQIEDDGFIQISTEEGFYLTSDNGGVLDLENLGNGGVYLISNAGGGVFLRDHGGGGTFVDDYDGGGTFFTDHSSGGLYLSGLPTSAPGGSNQVWNSSGTLKITPP